jgi:hypothetical protein
MANTLYRYLPLGLGEDREKDRRFACGRWPLGRIVSLVLVAFVALLLLFNSSGHVRVIPLRCEQALTASSDNIPSTAEMDRIREQPGLA